MKWWEEIYLEEFKKYKPEYDDGVNPLDPRISVDWPEEITNISDKDSKREFLLNAYEGVQLELPSL